ncbi:MAG: LysM peptidoglycan-binding domain-containing protein [Chloroflexi bacterium]|nr:LysM peptidoglycan-binding domain-containing protein [Chloroflexota bacterium]
MNIATLWLMGCAAVQALIGAPPTPAASLAFETYRVKEGDTLGAIAARYRTTVEQLIALNGDEYPDLARDPSLLQTGWELRVPTIVAGRTPAIQPKADLFETARLIIDGINTARAQRGIGLLRSHATLARIAGDRSRDMLARNYFSHHDPETGQDPLLRYLQASKFTYSYAGENIAEIKNETGFVPSALTVAARYSTAELAQRFVDDWLKSPEHRENIFSLRYQRTGVGLAVSEDGRRMTVTQVFSD